jgi:two-component system, cell cycle response regulator
MADPPPKLEELENTRDRRQATQVVDVDPRNKRTRGVLTIAQGVEAGRVLSLATGTLTTLGRVPECTFAFDDPSLSREHARVLLVGNDWMLKDASSTNGTFVNDQRVTAATALRDGDRIQLGSGTMLRFALVDEAEETALKKVYEAASRDGLTGVFNRKSLEERIAGELEFAKRHGTELSVIICDVDFFKKVNDTHGHIAGDAVLKEVARRLQTALRADDVLARYGGEEFVVLSRGIPVEAAVELAERLRATLAAQPVPFDAISIPITASLGVASLAQVGRDADKAKLVGAADARLYQAKQSGRNRVVAYRDHAAAKQKRAS